MHIKFLGATGTVTGSKYLVHAGEAAILVDCGLFQGYKQLRLRNREPLPVKPATIGAVVLTHAHLDHSGYLPLLVRQGFKHRIYCTEATYELCKIILPDSGHLLEEEAAYANRHGYSKHSPALPLYTADDALHALKQFTPVEFGKPVKLGGGLTATLKHAGHILGAAMVVLQAGGKTLTFSGDLGRPDDPIMKPPAHIEHTDYLVLESTYGNRRHDPADPALKLGQVISDTIGRGGAVVIPSFAVGRAQTLLHTIHRLKESGAIPSLLPVFLNSPMAIDATAIYKRHREDLRLSAKQCEAMCRAATLVNTVEQSIALNQQRMPMVIIAASGMATGGRVLHHLKALAPDPRNTILFSGYQAGGTRGAAMIGGAESIKIHGQYVPIRAQVTQLENLSAHADGGEIVDWLKHLDAPPKRIFITHGEPDAADALRRAIEERLHWRCRIPEYFETADLGG